MLTMSIEEAPVTHLDGLQIRALVGPPPTAKPETLPLHEGSPQAFLVEYARPGEIKPHFHPVSQFQIIVAGEGAIGKHAVRPVSVHYTDGYTPYGPITWEGDELSFFNLRSIPDLGAFYMPESRKDMSPRKAGRSLVWDIDLTDLTGTQDGFPDESDGLVCQVHQAEANSPIPALDPSTGGDQFQIVIEGSVANDDNNFDKWSCIYASPDDPAPSLQAGPDGATVLVLQFPKVAAD